MVDEETGGRIATEAEATAFAGRKRAHSTGAFGLQSPIGVARHVAKEVDEVACDPRDGGEWADVTLLALDGAWRAGASDGEVGGRLAAALDAAGVADLHGADAIALLRLRAEGVAGEPGDAGRWMALLDAATSGWAASVPGEDRSTVLVRRQARNEARAWARPTSADDAVEHVRG